MFDLIKTVATTPHKSSPSALNIPTLAVIPGQFPNGPRGRIHSGGRFCKLSAALMIPRIPARAHCQPRANVRLDRADSVGAMCGQARTD
eukprot:2590333-Rhodomonas_salina.3